MERFDFFFSLHVGEGLYSNTDNLSKDLQGTKMAVVSGQRLANLTKQSSQKYPLMIRASTISMLMFPAKVKACLVNQRFQESDALQPDWRLVLVQTAKGSI